RAVVRDDDELRAVGELAERLGEAADVALVERRVDLVEDAKRRRPHAQDSEEQRRGRKRALATRQLGEAADPLARRSRIDVDPWIFHVFARTKRRLAAVEQPLEEDPEFAVDGLQRRAELVGDRGRELAGERSEIQHRALEVILLRR